MGIMGIMGKMGITILNLLKFPSIPSIPSLGPLRPLRPLRGRVSGVVRNHLNYPNVLIVLSQQNPNFLSEGVRLGIDMKLGWMGHTERISHSAQ